ALQRGVQGEGGAGGDPGRPDAGGAGSETRHPPYDNRGVEAAGDRKDGRHVLRGKRCGPGCQRARGREALLEDRSVGCGARFFSQSLRSMSVARRRAMIEPAHQRLSIATQCRPLSISRSSYYYAPVPESEETLALMRVIDAAFLDMPWCGSRQMVRHLAEAVMMSADDVCGG